MHSTRDTIDATACLAHYLIHENEINTKQEKKKEEEEKKADKSKTFCEIILEY